MGTEQIEVDRVDNDPLDPKRLLASHDLLGELAECVPVLAGHLRGDRQSPLRFGIIPFWDHKE